MIRSPYLELWISSLLGILLGLWPESPLLWCSLILFITICRNRSVGILFILVGLIRAQLALTFESPKAASHQQSYEAVTGLPRELTQDSLNKNSKESVGDGWPLLKRLRQTASRLLDSQFPLLDSFRKAVILGSTNSLPSEIWDPMNYLGLSHLLVISGSHITVIILLILSVLKIVRPISSIFLYRWIALITVTIFLTICKIDISIVRAFLCFVLISIVSIWWPQFHRLRLSERLSFLATLIGWIAPLSAMQTTYVLSFGVTWALFRSQEHSKDLRSTMRFVAPYSMIYPLCGILGLSVHPISILTNIFFGSVFVMVLVPLSLISIPIHGLESTAEKLLRHYFHSIKWLADLTAQHWSVEYWGRAGFFFLLITILVVFQIDRMTVKVRYSCLIGVLSIFIVAPLFLKPASKKVNGIEIEFVDVGQGDGVIVRFGDKNILVDGGGPRLGTRQLLPTLRDRMSGRVDLWVFSHYDRDHRGNFEEIRSRVSVDQIWVPRLDGSRFSSILKVQFAEKIKELKTTVRDYCDKEYCFSCASTQEGEFNRTVGNSDSLACYIWQRSSRELRFVTTGDLPAKQERAVLSKLEQMGLRYPINGLLGIKLGHHGSKTSSGEQFIRHLDPAFVILTAGRNNQYGFPHEPVLTRLASKGIRIFRTDALGSFKVHFDN